MQKITWTLEALNDFEDYMVLSQSGWFYQVIDKSALFLF